MQIGIGISLTGGLRTGFSLSSLFANGTYAGFDFSDLDPAKTWGTESLKLFYLAGAAGPSPTAVSASGNAVGVALDKSASVALGAEVLTNGDFSSGTGWTTGSGNSISGGFATWTGASPTSQMSQTVPLTGATDYYVVSFDVTAYTQGTIGLLVGTNGGGLSRTSVGTSRSFYTRTNAGTAGTFLVGTTSFAGSVDNASVKPVSGNHATQGTSSSRPIYTVSGATKYLSFDGTDDALSDTFVPGAAMTIAVCFRAANTGATQIAVGASDASSNRSFLGVNASGALAGGWESQSTTVITDGVSVVGTDVVGLLSANASTVELWKNGVLVYSAAASGSPNTTIALALGALNANGTLSTFLNGRIYGAVSVARADLSTSDKIALQRLLGALAGLSF